MLGKKTAEMRVVREADKIVSMKENVDALSWGRVLEIGKQLPAVETDEERNELSRELIAIAQANVSLSLRLGIDPAPSEGRVMASGVEIVDGGLAAAAIEQHTQPADSVQRADLPEPAETPQSEEARLVVGGAWEALPSAVAAPTGENACEADDAGGANGEQGKESARAEAEELEDGMSAADFALLEEAVRRALSTHNAASSAQPQGNGIPSQAASSSIHVQGLDEPLIRSQADDTPAQLQANGALSLTPADDAPSQPDAASPSLSQADDVPVSVADAAEEAREQRATPQREAAAEPEPQPATASSLDQPTQPMPPVKHTTAEPLFSMEEEVAEFFDDPDEPAQPFAAPVPAPEPEPASEPPAASSPAPEPAPQPEPELAPVPAPEPAPEPQPAPAPAPEQVRTQAAQQKFARFRNIYASRDGSLCVFEDEHGHLVAVDASKLV